MERESTVRHDIAARKSGDPPRSTAVTLKTDRSRGARGDTEDELVRTSTSRSAKALTSRVDAPPRRRRGDTASSSSRRHGRSRRSAHRTSRSSRRGGRRSRRQYSESDSSDSSDDDTGGQFSASMLRRSRNMPLIQSSDTQRGGVLPVTAYGVTMPAARATVSARDFVQTSGGNLTFAPLVSTVVPSARILDRASRSVLDRSGYTGRNNVGGGNAGGGGSFGGGTTRAYDPASAVRSLFPNLSLFIFNTTYD